MMKKTAGERMAEARRRADLTQLNVADELGVSYQAVSSWERDEYLPDTKNLVGLARLLGVSVNSLTEDSPYDFETKREIFNWKHQKTFVKTTASTLGMTNTLSALEFAVEAHKDQKRKNSDIPYISHPLMLACDCVSMGIREDCVIAACLLHDVIEDCGVTEDQLPVDDETRRLVMLMTHPDEGNDRKAMLEKYFRGLSSDPKAALIKCVDRYNNLTTMSWGLRRERQLRYIAETEQYVLPLVDVLKKRPEYNSAAWSLRYRIESMLDVYKRLI